MEKLGKNIADELDSIAQRVIGERKIESIVRLDETAMSNCVKFITQKIPEQKIPEWKCALMVTAVMKFLPIHRLSGAPETRLINEIFAITIVTDFMPEVFNSERYYSQKKSGAFLRHLLSYFFYGFNDPCAITLMLQSIDPTALNEGGF